MTLAKFDATTDHAIASKYGLSGYPTLVLFNEDGTTTNLKQLGPHNDAWIANWLRRRVTGTATKKLTTADEVKEFRAAAEVVCVFFSDSQSAVFESTALSWQDPTLRWAIAGARCLQWPHHGLRSQQRHQRRQRQRHLQGRTVS